MNERAEGGSPTRELTITLPADIYDEVLCLAARLDWSLVDLIEDVIMVGLLRDHADHSASRSPRHTWP